MTAAGTDGATGTTHFEEITVDLDDARLTALLGELDLADKVLLLTGQDFWSTAPIEKIGLRSMVLSDGPSGVRGPSWDERSPSLNLPSASALSSGWSPELARAYGEVSAGEARRKGVDIVLGPTINLHRSPLGGRHFEAFSEDPVLTAELAAAYVTGVQSRGVAATLKHYIANDFETDRFTADVEVDERTLRELYLLAFEKAVTEAHSWAVMSSYNSLNGSTVTENEVLETPLNSEWGFDGVVVSDWTAVRSVNSARYSQDLVMPGPGAWGDALVAAVESGEIAEELIDRKVLRILQLAARVGAIDGVAASGSSRAHSVEGDAADGVLFARHAESEGMVLVANDGILPLTTGGSGGGSSAPARIAVIGHNADVARSQGGGSATVVPEHVVSPLEGIRAAFPDAEVTYEIGAVVQSGVAELPLSSLRNPSTGEPGAHVRFLDGWDDEIFAEDRFATSFVWFGGDAPVEDAATLEVTTEWTPNVTGTVRLGFSGVGRGEISVDGEVVVDETAEMVGTDLGAALLSPPSRSARVEVEAGRAVTLTVTFTRGKVGDALAGAMSFAFGLEADDTDPESLIARAVDAAAAADLVVLVVGTNSAVESEGFDRSDLKLPGHQDDLAARVLAANPRSVVLVNAGSPVELPWVDAASAVLLGWFGGQEFGSAVGDVLTGAVEPGGRLPTTWPVRMSDVPVLDVTPVDGVVRYSEGVHIGYRVWARAVARGGAAPRYWFGHGLGYTTFSESALTAPTSAEAGAPVSVSLTVTNTGSRRGKHVVQVYASRSDSAIDRAALWLVGFAAVELDAGSARNVTLSIPGRAFAHWDGGRDGSWAYEEGAFELRLGRSAGDLGDPATITIT